MVQDEDGIKYVHKTDTKKEWGVWQMLTKLTEGGGGVGQMLTMADKGGRGVGEMLTLANKRGRGHGEMLTTADKGGGVWTPHFWPLMEEETCQSDSKGYFLDKYLGLNLNTQQ